MTDRQIWFLTGSQGLYGEDVLEQVATQSRRRRDSSSTATCAGPLPRTL